MIISTNLVFLCIYKNYEGSNPVKFSLLPAVTDLRNFSVNFECALGDLTNIFGIIAEFGKKNPKRFPNFHSGL